MRHETRERQARSILYVAIPNRPSLPGGGAKKDFSGSTSCQPVFPPEGGGSKTIKKFLMHCYNPFQANNQATYNNLLLYHTLFEAPDL